MSELSILDMDAGIRTLGKYGAKKCFVFVTKSVREGGYVSVLYSIKASGKESIPDKQLLAKEFGSLQELEKFLEGVVAKPVKAYSY